MNKFVNNLSASNSTIKQARAEAMAEETIIEVEGFVNNLRKERSRLNTLVTSLTDLAPDNAYSLRPGGKDFNASKWVADLHEAKMKLALKEIELSQAVAIHKEWFIEEIEIIEPAPKSKSKTKEV